jgi:hypothetical protein
MQHYVEFVEALMYGHFVKKQVKRRCSMPHRAMASVGVVAAALVVAAFAAIPLAGQTPTVAAQASKPSSTWTLPRTPDGKPDLQGTWLNFDQTPFEQPDPAMKNAQGAPAAGAVAPAPAGGGNGFADQTVLVPRRPSMVVEPANGRVPVMAWAEIPTSIPAHLSTLTSSMAPPFEEKPTPYIHFVSRA